MHLLSSSNLPYGGLGPEQSDVYSSIFAHLISDHTGIEGLSTSSKRDKCFVRRPGEQDKIGSISFGDESMVAVVPSKVPYKSIKSYFGSVPSRRA